MMIRKSLYLIFMQIYVKVIYLDLSLSNFQYKNITSDKLKEYNKICYNKP